MEVVSLFFIRLSQWMDPYLIEVCMAQVATFLVIHSGELDKYFRKLLKPTPFLVRVTGFVLLNAFGYGIVTIFGARVLTSFYWQIGSSGRVPVIISVFILIGILAERRKQI